MTALGAVSVGRIHGVFFNRLRDLMAFAAKAETQATTGSSAWFIPNDIFDPTNSEEITAAFDRNQISENYQQCLEPNSGTAGDAIALKLQGDYVACLERSYRASVASPVRCIGHSLARRAGHSSNNGVFGGGVIELVQSAITAGQGG